MAFNKYAGIFPILFGISTIIIGIFLPLGIGSIDMIGLAGWKINLSVSPLEVIEIELIGILSPFLSIFSPILGPSLYLELILIVMGSMILSLGALIILFGILELVKKESIAFPIVNIILAVMLIILTIVDYILFTRIIFPKYRDLFYMVKSLVSLFYYPSLMFLPAIVDIYVGIGFYLILISQIVILIISIVALVITAHQKRKA